MKPHSRPTSLVSLFYQPTSPSVSNSIDPDKCHRKYNPAFTIRQNWWNSKSKFPPKNLLIEQLWSGRLQPQQPGKMNNYYLYGMRKTSDDQTVDTTSTWEDRGLRSRSNSEEDQDRIMTQTVVYVNRNRRHTDDYSIFPTTTTTTAKDQHDSQKKNKVLMLLQLEQVLATRSAIQEKWDTLRTEFFVELVRRQLHRKQIRNQKIELLERMQRQRRRQIQMDSNILELEEFYRKFDICLEELHERNDIMELEGFKQLVIREVEERAEAVELFRERLKVVHGQLMQRFIVDELIEGGLYDGPKRRKPLPREEMLYEWVHVEDEDNYLPTTTTTGVSTIHFEEQVDDEEEEGSEWVVCDF